MEDPGSCKVAVVKEPPKFGGSFYRYIWGLNDGKPLYIGDRPEARTRNPLIKSQLLYH
jgi:hypothetical protein